jgi:hypothetical protein
LDDHALTQGVQDRAVVLIDLEPIGSLGGFADVVLLLLALAHGAGHAAIGSGDAHPRDQ